jgi:hypothetical protein
MAKRKKSRSKPVPLPAFEVNNCLRAAELAERANCGLAFASFILNDPSGVEKRGRAHAEAGLYTARKELDKLVLEFKDELGKPAKRARLAASRAMTMLKKGSEELSAADAQQIGIAVSKASGLNEVLRIQAKSMCLRGRA